MPPALLAGAWLIGTLTVDHLLTQDAIMTGRGWASALVDNVTDLDRIAAGNRPSPESQRFFDRVQKVGQVFRYVVYDRDGRVRLASNDIDEAGSKDARGPDLNAMSAVATGAPVLKAEESVGADAGVPPPYFAETYVPIASQGKTVGVVETIVDQTEKRSAYRRTLVAASASLTALVALAFGIPAFALVRRRNEKRTVEARIHFLAHHDALTGLINRDRLSATVEPILMNEAEGAHALALHYIDVDRFKDINDTLGHDTGDALIVAVASRLQRLAGPGERVARLGGDEFIVVQTEWASAPGAEAFACELVRELAQPFDIAGHSIAITVSVGVAVAPLHGQSMTRLMKSADLALYRSKTNGRNTQHLFTPEMDQALAERLRLERCLRQAVASDGFDLHFQPAVEMPARKLVGFEALIRMRDEEGRLVPPTAFIPLAEKMGLIDQIGTWVLRKACQEAATWPAGLKVAVNLSPIQLATGHLAETVAAVLAETQLEPHRLELEVTEGMLLDDSESIMTELRKLKALQVGIVMDDFGTGYSGLSYLWKFPFDKIKIDRAFMLALDEEQRGEASTIVKTMIDLGRSLDVTVSVEGVENEQQARFVSEARCDQIQGYYFGRPIPGTELAAHIIKSLCPDLDMAASADRLVAA